MPSKTRSRRNRGLLSCSSTFPFFSSPPVLGLLNPNNCTLRLPQWMLDRILDASRMSSFAPGQGSLQRSPSEHILTKPGALSYFCYCFSHLLFQRSSTRIGAEWRFPKIKHFQKKLMVKHMASIWKCSIFSQRKNAEKRGKREAERHYSHIVFLNDLL